MCLALFLLAHVHLAVAVSHEHEHLMRIKSAIRKAPRIALSAAASSTTIHHLARTPLSPPSVQLLAEPLALALVTGSVAARATVGIIVANGPATVNSITSIR